MNIKTLKNRINEINQMLDLENDDEIISDLNAEVVLLLNAIEIFEKNQLENVKVILVDKIKWDADKDMGLPKKIIIDINLATVQLLNDINGYAKNLSDYLSDVYECSHKGFKITLK